ncbi:TRAP transporter substrate-binding protein [Effusibacillus lacus]|uniref:ABC transporter substrate-binding protein n=1 Tax=Effusibacillus lacus TaxID=1348429 RepID=A0A292YFJ0_9BACL|nr:TRAP transporter substrate-binding protein [Effusibacillus lacus]TCS68595.1 C4-dicarboxylate-binding protein DctP [Effusibacillus lacus]GAX88817.1 ABC transporter substrate-binding protein [Effusibacillus lacus]
MKKRMFSFFSSVLTTVLILSGCSSSTPTRTNTQRADQKVTIKIAHESPASHPKGIWADTFKKAVEEKSGGKISVEVFHQGSLYPKEQAALEAVNQGIIQMSLGSTGYLSSIEPTFGVFDLPMLFPSQESLYKATDGKVGKELLDKLEAKGLKGLGYVANVPLDLFSKSPITSIDQISGQKIRVHTAELEKSVKTLGGNPITMPASEVYMALQQGVLQGVLTTVSYAAPNKLSEVVKNMTDIKISSIVYPIVINLDFWKGLSPENQKIIEEATQVAIKANRDDLEQIMGKHLKTLQDGGVKIHKLSADEHAKWKTKLHSIYDEFKDKQLLEKVNQAIK